MIDKAVIRRFAVHHKIIPLSSAEIVKMVRRYVDTTGMTVEGDLGRWAGQLMTGLPQAQIINMVNQAIADAVLEEKNEIIL